jgi:hypothetical protein
MPNKKCITERAFAPSIFLLTLTFNFIAISAENGQFKPAGSSYHSSSVIDVVKYNDGDYKFLAYIVEHKGGRVVVSDPLGKSLHEKGGAISYMEIRSEGADSKLLSFLISPIVPPKPSDTSPAP